MLVIAGNDGRPSRIEPMSPQLQPPPHCQRYQVLNEETAMHPVITYDLIQAHVADLRVRARRHTLARAARPGAGTTGTRCPAGGLWAGG
jgi:hypothetical protein